MCENEKKKKNYGSDFWKKYYDKYGKAPNSDHLFIIDATDRDENNIIELNNILEKNGIEFIMEDHETSTGKRYSTLNIKINFDIFEKEKTRGAGNPKKKKEIGSNIKVKDLKRLKKIEKKSNVDLIEMLGCSRASFYREWKNVKDTNAYDDNYFFSNVSSDCMNDYDETE